MMVQNAMARVLVGVWCAQGLVSPPPRGLRPVSGGRVAAAEGASAEAPVAVVAELPLPVEALHVRLYPAVGLASTVAYACCACSALGSHPRLALPALHTRLTIAQALVPLPTLVAVVAALDAAAAKGWDRLKSPTYRRLNLGLAFASAWLALGCWRAPLFAGKTRVDHALGLRVGATAAHAASACVASAAWAASVAVANPARKGWSSLWSHRSPLDRDVFVALSPLGALSRVVRGVGGSLATALPQGGGGGALSDPDSPSANSGALAYAAVFLAFTFWTGVAAVADHPLATLPYALGRRFSRAAGAFCALTATVAFVLKDAAERGRSDASTFVTLRTGLKRSMAAHLLVNAAKVAFDDLAMYPAALSRPLWTCLASATFLAALAA